MKSDHKYELTKIERTSVLTLNGTISDCIMSTSVIRALRAPNQQSEAL
jgi:hypothetical protein